MSSIVLSMNRLSTEERTRNIQASVALETPSAPMVPRACLGRGAADAVPRSHAFGPYPATTLNVGS